MKSVTRTHKKTLQISSYSFRQVQEFYAKMNKKSNLLFLIVIEAFLFLESRIIIGLYTKR